MDKPIENFWQIRLNDLKKELESNNFEVFVAESAAEAKNIVMENIIPVIKPKSISWGGSMTFIATGLYEALKNSEDMEVLDPLDKKITPEQA
jgi:L-lactate utilization protein LutB